MAHQVPRGDRRQAWEIVNEFIERDLLCEAVEEDVRGDLDDRKPVEALRTIIQHRESKQ